MIKKILINGNSTDCAAWAMRIDQSDLVILPARNYFNGQKEMRRFSFFRKKCSDIEKNVTFFCNNECAMEKWNDNSSWHVLNAAARLRIQIWKKMSLFCHPKSNSKMHWLRTVEHKSLMCKTVCCKNVCNICHKILDFMLCDFRRAAQPRLHTCVCAWSVFLHMRTRK